jgi:DNA-binding winged helix-turn-helix (wHTH) protein
VAKELYEFGPFRVDPEKETLFRAGEAVPLTPKTFQILLVLIRNSNEVVTKDNLLKTVWPGTFVEEANLSRNVFMLRKALGESAQDHRYIVTVPGRGYRLAESVQVVPDQELTVIAASRSKMQLEVRESRSWGWIAIVAPGSPACPRARHMEVHLTSPGSSQRKRYGRACRFRQRDRRRHV